MVIRICECDWRLAKLDACFWRWPVKLCFLGGTSRDCCGILVGFLCVANWLGPGIHVDIYICLEMPKVFINSPFWNWKPNWNYPFWFICSELNYILLIIWRTIKCIQYLYYDCSGIFMNNEDKFIIKPVQHIRVWSFIGCNKGTILTKSYSSNRSNVVIKCFFIL